MAGPTQNRDDRMTSTRRDRPSPSDQLRVLVVTAGAELYGSDRMLLEAVRGMCEKGFEVIVAAATPGPLLSPLADAGASTYVVATPVLRRSYASVRGVIRLACETARALPTLVSALRRIRPDVVYVNTATLPLWTALGAALRIPTVVHVHEAESGTNRAVRTALSAAVVPADHAIFNSRTSENLAHADLGRALGEASIVLNAVPFSGPVEAARPRLDGPVRVIYVGRLSHRKGVDVALDAVGLLRGTGLDVRLDVVGNVFPGNEAYEEKLRRRAEEDDLRGTVTFHGFQESTHEFMASGDIALVPSRGPESFGNVLIEAVGAGRPTVATTQTGLIEAAEGLGSVQLVPESDAAALAEGISHHIEHWAQARRDAAIDAVLARHRHDPAVYRRAVAAVVAKTSGRGTANQAAISARCSSNPQDLVADARTLVISPHLDDAALSAFGLLSLGDQVDVLTLLDGAPSPPVRTGWDRLCGFADSDEALEARLAENSAALGGSPHRLLSLGLLDAQYLDGARPRADSQALIDAVRDWTARQSGPIAVAVPAGAGLLARVEPVRTHSDRPGHRARRAQIRRAVGPLGESLLNARARLVAKRARPIQHEDHVWARDVILQAGIPNATVILYEELPYRWGARADEAVAALDPCSAPDVVDLAVDREAKLRAVACYQSQLAYMYAPLGSVSTVEGWPTHERYWRFGPADTARFRTR